MLVVMPSQVLWSSVTASGVEGLSVLLTKLTSNSKLRLSPNQMEITSFSVQPAERKT